MTKALSLYLASVIPAALDRTKVSDRRAKLELSLKASSISFSVMWETGSFSHGTAISQYSDVDYLASVAGPKPTLPSSALAAFKKSLQSADSNIYKIEVASPTIRIEYFSEPIIEIAPGYIFDLTPTHSIYEIAGPNDQWIKTSPGAHLAYVNDANDALSKRVKSLIRLIKAWKYSQKVPISSFYLEMRTTEYALTQDSILFDLDLRFALNHIIRAGLADMNDPTGSVGRIPACSSSLNQATSLRQMKDAVAALEEAYEKSRKGDWFNYWLQMSNVFNNFPYEIG